MRMSKNKPIDYCYYYFFIKSSSTPFVLSTFNIKTEKNINKNQKNNNLILKLNNKIDFSLKIITKVKNQSKIQKNNP
jgi:hypothetical protein